MMAKLFAGALDCPRCGEKLRRWPTLNSDGFVASCPSCEYEVVKKVAPNEESEPRPEEPAQDRFRRLLSAGAELPPAEEWPEDLRAQLKKEESQGAAEGQDTSGYNPAGDGTFRSDTERRLKEHGYYLYEDSRGARLSGPGPGAGTGDLSPLDVVNLAANLEGGVPSGEQRRSCPHCQAIVATGAQTCPWCDGQLPPTTGGTGSSGAD